MFNELHTSHMFVNMGFSFGTGLILFKLDQQSLVSYVDPGSPAREQYFWAVNTNSPRGSPLTLPGPITSRRRMIVLRGGA
jgi:hypothetical protein